MLATGGSCIAAIQMLKNRGVKNIRFMCIIAAPEGVRPARAVLRELENGTWKEPVVFGSNMRAGREYRSFLADTLLNRALEEIRNGTEPDKEER